MRREGILCLVTVAYFSFQLGFLKLDQDTELFLLNISTYKARCQHPRCLYPFFGLSFLKINLNAVPFMHFDTKFHQLAKSFISVFPQNRHIDVSLNCYGASLCSRTFLKSWKSLGSSVCKAACSCNASHSHVVIVFLWGTHDVGSHPAGL